MGWFINFNILYQLTRRQSHSKSLIFNLMWSLILWSNIHHHSDHWLHVPRSRLLDHNRLRRRGQLHHGLRSIFLKKCFQHWSWLIKGSLESDLRKLLQHFRRRWVFWQILTDWSQLWTQSWVTGSNNQNAASFIQSETGKAKKGQISWTWWTYNQSLNSAQVLGDD